MKDESKFYDVISSITSALSNPEKQVGKTTLITIDGPAGSGKTTLAKRIKELFENSAFTCQIIHADDLYNGWHDALGQSLTDTFLDFLLPGLESEQEFLLPQYDWVLHEFSQPSRHSPSDLLIVEGVGSSQSVMRARSALSIWIEVDDETGLIRVLNRDGAAIRSHMHEFQIAQRQHFLSQKTKESSDFHFDGAP